MATPFPFLFSTHGDGSPTKLRDPRDSTYDPEKADAISGLTEAVNGRPIQSAGNLAQEALLRSRAQQQDFENGYTGSMLAPQWTPMLQALKEAGVGRLTQAGGQPLPQDPGLGWGPPNPNGDPASAVPPSLKSTAPFSVQGEGDAPGPFKGDTPERRASRTKMAQDSLANYTVKYPGAPQVGGK